MMWLQGLENAPPIVKLCFELWKELNPEYELIVCDHKDVNGVLDGFPIPISCLSPQALSDVFRMKLLFEYGGVWADATVLPVAPLRAWLEPCAKSAELAAFEAPGPDRPLSSWFLACPPASRIVAIWWREVLRYWRKPRSLMRQKNGKKLIPENPIQSVAPEGGANGGEYPYFWLHYLFGYLLKVDARVANAWAISPKWPASQAHALQALFAGNASPDVSQIYANMKKSHVQKLNWREAYPVEQLREIAMKCSREY